MFKATPLVFVWLGLQWAGCAQTALPSLSVHALTWLKRRNDGDERRLVRTWSVDLQLSLAVDDVQRAPPADALDTRETLRAVSALSPGTADANACEPPSLCEWARLAEEAALLALGVSP